MKADRPDTVKNRPADNVNTAAPVHLAFMQLYAGQKRMLIAIDCIIFGFDGKNLKLLLIKRAFEPARNKWSLMGGFLRADETLPEAADRVLLQLTGLSGVYMEQLQAFSDLARDPKERTVSIGYFALIDIHQFETQLSDQYHAEWFPLAEKPRLIFDHDEMVLQAQKQLRYRAAMHPILFELLPGKFTIPQLQLLYEAVYDTKFDSRNFIRKIMSTRLLVKQKTKDKTGSKKGAFFYRLHQQKYKQKQDAFLNFVYKAEKFI